MLLICSLLFFALLIFCLITGAKIAWALLAGLGLFWLYGRRQGFSHRQLWEMAWAELRKALIVVSVVFLIGIITGLWRSGGTIAFAIVKGMELVTPNLFLLIAFLLSAALSYVLGTSFGVASTMGVILMALARSGGVDIAVTAGVILSGIYFGDRCSPASSAASLVAAVTETELYGNVRMMLRTGLLPTLVTVAVYTALSFAHPITAVDEGVLTSIRGAFSVSWTALLPAAVMLILPLLKVNIRCTMLCSIAVSAVIAILKDSVWKDSVFIAQMMGVSWGALAGAFLAPFLYGLYSKKVTKAAAAVSFAFGTGLELVQLAIGVGLISVKGIPVLEFVFTNSLYSGVFAMVGGLILVPIVSLFTQKTLPDNIEAKFSCYEKTVVTNQKISLG